MPFPSWQDTSLCHKCFTIVAAVSPEAPITRKDSVLVPGLCTEACKLMQILGSPEQIGKGSAQGTQQKAKEKLLLDCAAQSAAAYTTATPPLGSEANTEFIEVTCLSWPRPHQPWGSCGSSLQKLQPESVTTLFQSLLLSHSWTTHRHGQSLTMIIHNVTSKWVSLKTCMVVVEDVLLPLIVCSQATATLLNLETHNNFLPISLSVAHPLG